MGVPFEMFRACSQKRERVPDAWQYILWWLAFTFVAIEKLEASIVLFTARHVVERVHLSTGNLNIAVAVVFVQVYKIEANIS